MLRKNIAPVVATILSGLLFIIIGSCFSAFLYNKEMIRVENPKVLVANGISVYNEEEKVVETLKLSKLKLGLKPATGEEDAETNIPSTITDKQGSEGLYGKLLVHAPAGAKIVINNIIIESNKSQDEINKERKNIMVSVKEVDKSTKSLLEESVELGTINSSNDKQTLTFYIWLSGKATDVLESSTISFDINFKAIN